MSELTHYLDRYAKENFIIEYKDYLNSPDGKCPYQDIDAVDSMDVCFYKDLSTFLSKSLGMEFKEPDKNEYPFAIKYQDMFLTSDQFGFSAPAKDGKNKKYKKSKAWNGEKSYPYARYLSVKCDDDKGAEDAARNEFVAECIYETRTIGGSFIWPKVQTDNGYQSEYNFRRGIGSYMEDRVDITLYEIKCFYDFCAMYFEKRGLDANFANIMSNEEDFRDDYGRAYSTHILINSQSVLEQRALYRWFMIFHSFEDYVEKLKFESFVIRENDTYLIRDMASKDSASQLNMIAIKKIQDMNFDEIHTLLTNVKECTQKRSEAING